MVDRLEFWPRGVRHLPIVLVLATVMLVGGFAGLAHPASGAAPVGPLPSHAAPSAQPATVSGPIGGRLFNTSLTAPDGFAFTNTLALDPQSQTGFSLNTFTGNLASFNITSGTALAMTQLANPTISSPRSIVLDPIHHHLFVSVRTYSAYPSSLLVLNESTLAVVANITTFGSDAQFVPAYLLYDPTSTQVLAENTSNLDTAVVNTTSLTVTTVVTFSCTSCFPAGFIDVTNHAYVLLPDYTSSFPSLNTSTDTAATGITAANTAFSAGVGAYDNVTGFIYVSNYSSTGDIEVFSPTGSYIGTPALGPAYATAATFLWTGDMMAFADRNATFPGAGWEVFCYISYFGVLTDHYNNPAIPVWEPGYTFTGLYPDVTASGSYLLTSGGGNASVEFAVNTSTDTLTVRQAYAGFADDRFQVFTDPGSGRYYVLDQYPNEVVGYSATTNARLWTIDLSYGGYYYAAPIIAVDTVQHYLYVSFSLTSVQVYSTVNGAYLTSITYGSDVGRLAVDATHHYLYAADAFTGGHNITIVNTLGNVNTLVNTIPWTEYICGLAAIPTLDEVAASGCSFTAPTDVAVFSASSFLELTSFEAAPYVFSDVSVDGNGSLYLAGASTGNVTVFDTARGVFGTNWTLGSAVAVTGVAADPVDGIGIAESSSIAAVQVVSLATGQVLSSIALPTVGYGRPDFSAATATFYAPVFYTGQVLTAQLISVPSAPTGLALTPGNGTLTAHWTAAAGAPGYPVLNYTVLRATSASGPWTEVATATTLTATLSGLTDGTTYYVSVRAVSASGTGPNSSVQSAIPVGVPYPPTSVTLGGATAASLNVTWGAPASTQGSAVTNYTVEFAKGASGPWTVESAGTALALKLTGLTASTTYFVRVVAWNAVGGSGASSVASLATLAPPSTGASGSPLGGMTLLLVVLVVVVIAAVLGAVLLLRRRKTPPAGPTTTAPPTGAMGSPTPPPPGSNPPPPGAA